MRIIKRFRFVLRNKRENLFPAIRRARVCKKPNNFGRLYILFLLHFGQYLLLRSSVSFVPLNRHFMLFCWSIHVQYNYMSGLTFLRGCVLCNIYGRCRIGAPKFRNRILCSLLQKMSLGKVWILLFFLIYRLNSKTDWVS